MSGFSGSIAIDPMASEHSPSVRGRQLRPASSVRQTPPCAPPAYTMSMFVGWTATVDTRPAVKMPRSLTRSGPSARQRVSVSAIGRIPPPGGMARLRRSASWRSAARLRSPPE